MAQAVMLYEDKEQDGLPLRTMNMAQKVQDQFNRYGIKTDGTFEFVINSPYDGSIKWFEGIKTNLTAEFLDRQVKNGLSEKIAFICLEDGDRQTITYGQLSSKVKKLTASLACNVADTDRVLIILPTCLEAVVSILGCLRLGLLFSIMEPNYKKCMQLRMDDFKPDIVITVSGCEFNKFLIKTVRAAATELVTSTRPRLYYIARNVLWRYHYETKEKTLDEKEIDFSEVPVPAYKSGQGNVEFPSSYCINKPLCVAYTAGTTGPPKGCVHSAFSLYMSCINDDGFTVHPLYSDNPVSFFFTELSNIVGLIGIVLKPLLFTVVSVLYEAVIDNAEPSQIYQILKESKVTSAYFFKSTLENLKSKDEDGAIAKSFYDQDLKLKIVFTSGSKMNEVIEWTRTLFSEEPPLQVYNFYAITELGGIIYTDHCNASGIPLTTSTTGRLAPFINAKIMRSTEAMEQNELIIEFPLPPVMMIRYCNDKNNQLFLKNFKNGYYATGHYGENRSPREDSLNFERTVPTFEEAQLIPEIEQYMSGMEGVKICCIICKTVNNVKRLYGFFQLTIKYEQDDYVDHIGKTMQVCIRYVYGGFINFEAINVVKMPALRKSKPSIPHRKLMHAILHDITQAENSKDNFDIINFAKVRKINGWKPELVDLTKD